MFSRIGRKAGSFIGTAVQVLGISHGVISGVTRGLSKPDQIPRNIVYDYTGVDIEGATGFNQDLAIKSATIIAVTFAVGWAIKQVARRM